LNPAVWGRNRFPPLDRRSAALAATFPTVGILLLNGYWNGPLYAASPKAFWLVDVLTHLIIPGALLLYIGARYAIKPADYGMRRSGYGSGEFLGLCLLTSIILWLAYRPVAVVVGYLLWSEPVEFTYSNALPEHTISKLAVGFYFSITAAVFEEIMYRGLPYLYLEQSVPRKFVVPVYTASSAALFGLAHWENGLHEVVAAFSFGCVACILYARIRTLIPLVVAHFLIDMQVYW